ncbi:MAG: hypothetical protein ACOX0A_00805 [Thermoguttaceae bacterium]
MTRTICAALLVLIALCQSTLAQNPRGGAIGRPYPASPGLRPINHPDIPTGQLAALKTLNERERPFQPVQWKLPEGVKVKVAQLGAFEEAPGDSNIFALQLGSVYRFKISDVATYPGQELYPTLEIIGKLRPPEGKEWEFPVEIEVPMRDLALAFRGNFVTRVIFVENSANAANVDASDTNESLTFDVPQSVDPVVAASVRGRPLAILRLGSRAPNGEPSESEPFFFGLPSVIFHTAIEEGETETLPKADVDDFKLVEPEAEEAEGMKEITNDEIEDLNVEPKEVVKEPDSAATDAVQSAVNDAIESAFDAEE